MSLGRTHFLLAGIPTGVALIGLLWLKHRRTNHIHHHTDPGGSNKQQLIEEKQRELFEKEIVEEELEVKLKKVEKEKLEENIIIKDNNIIVEGEQVLNTCEEVVEVIEEILNNSNIISNSVDNTLVEKCLDIVEVSEIPIENATSIETEQSGETRFNKEISTAVTNEEVVELSKAEDKLEKVEETEKDKILVKENLENSIENIKIEEEKEVEVIEKETVEEVVEASTIATTPICPSEAVKTATNMKTEPSQLAEKLASLELDTMKINEENVVDTEQKVCTERDSANHSPSEVMLASPSISNFSDAHSEGSSDSGKGHSDVATSPSRTPAGGSSLAGDLNDLAPSIYEFILPQVIVGRLIGRRGVFLHEIRSSTQTSIYIKRHPDTNKLKICAIEGTQQDIDKALAKIRQKFPLRRFPELTLEKVSFVNINPLPPLRLEDFHLQLVEGVNNDVILSSLITAAHFFLQQPSHPTYGSLGALNHVMNEIYSSSAAPLLESPIKDAVCAAPTMGGWYRAQIVDLDDEAGTCTVRFLDYGGYLVLDSSNLRQIRSDLLALPFQAVECYLANVAPADEEGWSDEARLFVHTATVGQVLQAQIYDYAEDGTPLVYLYASIGSQVVLINEELVIRGYGVLTSIPEE